MPIFTTAAICASVVRRQVWHRHAVDSGLLNILGSTDGYPGRGQVLQACVFSQPDLFFLDLEDADAALRCLKEIREVFPHATVVAIGSSEQFTSDVAGYFVVLPCEQSTFDEVVREAIRSRAADVVDGLFVFVPAKAGSGASTVSLCTATCLGSTFQRRTVLIDTDLRSSVQAAMINCTPRGSTQSVLDSAESLDRLSWRSMVTHCCGADFLLASDRVPDRLPDWHQYHALIRVLQPQYEFLIADLPELVNRSTYELVRRASRILIVTTQEFTAVTLAKRRISDLLAWQIPIDRIFCVCNRWHETDTSAAELETVLGRPILATISNDYQQIRSAICNAQFPLDTNGVLGRAYVDLCRQLQGLEPIPAVPRGFGRFLDRLFSAVPHH